MRRQALRLQDPLGLHQQGGAQIAVVIGTGGRGGGSLGHGQKIYVGKMNPQRALLRPVAARL